MTVRPQELFISAYGLLRRTSNFIKKSQKISFSPENKGQYKIENFLVIIEMQFFLVCNNFDFYIPLSIFEDLKNK